MVEKAIVLDPDDADYHAHLAYIFVRQEKSKLAEKSAREALALDPHQRSAHRFLALSLLNLGQKEEALFHARRAIELEPQSDDAHSCMGLCLLRTGDNEGALHHISEALRLNPGNGSARHNLVLAMGAKNPFYGLLWRVQLLMTRLPQWGRIGVMVGLWSIMHFVDVLGDKNPAFEPWAMGIIFLYLAFAIYAWSAPWLFKTWLRRRGAI
jgi:tetratricopeptide (TPR) repeat protein